MQGVSVKPGDVTLHPFENLEPGAFWKSGVEQADPERMAGLYQRKWAIGPDDRVATAGSCFAQHISRHMRACGFRVMDLEPAPRSLPADEARRFGYGLYSARYGNIYSTAQLLQLLREAAGTIVLSEADVVWRRADGACVDALRPGVEPEGLGTAAEVMEHRAWHLAQVRQMFMEMDVFIFTLGLTEVWRHRETGIFYPTAPGVIAGEFDPGLHVMENLDVLRAGAALEAFREEVVALRGGRGVRMILTVSPVPLTATASGQHVLAATTYSKAVLRAVAGQMAAEAEDVDYFPSYEIITNPAVRGTWYESNLRSVRDAGVRAAMGVFFGAHAAVGRGAPGPVAEAVEEGSRAEDVVCEDAVLNAFAG